MLCVKCQYFFYFNFHVNFDAMSGNRILSELPQKIYN